MATAQAEDFNISRVTAASLPSQPWWPQLHQVIIAAFQRKPENVTVFPPDWKRLPDDPVIAAQNLSSELGDRGHLFVILNNAQQPLASSGVLPYRGDSWINDAQTDKSDADIANSSHASQDDWEVCCFCVAPTYRGQGLSHLLLRNLEIFTAQLGARRLYANYAEIETGEFWPRMGFEVIPGAGGTLKKGFQVDPAKEGLRGDVVFKMAVKELKS